MWRIVLNRIIDVVELLALKVSLTFPFLCCNLFMDEILFLIGHLPGLRSRVHPNDIASTSPVERRVSFAFLFSSSPSHLLYFFFTMLRVFHNSMLLFWCFPGVLSTILNERENFCGHYQPTFTIVFNYTDDLHNTLGPEWHVHGFSFFNL